MLKWHTRAKLTIKSFGGRAKNPEYTPPPPPFYSAKRTPFSPFHLVPPQKTPFPPYPSLEVHPIHRRPATNDSLRCHPSSWLTIPVEATFQAAHADLSISYQRLFPSSFVLQFVYMPSRMSGARSDFPLDQQLVSKIPGLGPASMPCDAANGSPFLPSLSSYRNARIRGPIICITTTDLFEC